MRITLRAAVLVGALVGTGLMATETAQAGEHSKSDKTIPVVAKAQPASKKCKAAPLAQKSAAKPTAARASALLAHHGKAAPLAQKSAAKPIAAKAAVLLAHHGKAVSLARQGASATHVWAAKSASTHVAQNSHAATYAHEHENGGYARTMQRRGLNNKLFAGNAEMWQEPGQLAVQSGSALVIEQNGGEALYEKNANAIVPIASITKLMTAMVVLDSLPNLQAPIAITEEDVDYLRNSRSRLQVGTVLARETALLLALMSSENRAANALGRNYPGGLPAFVTAMNRKAASLGMNSSHFEDPTGLTSNNVSTAHDLARMVDAAHRYPLIREFSTTSGVRAEVKGREIEFHNTNQLVSSPTWEIGLSKTGYIQEAGKCLVMQARVADKPVVIVLLDSAGKQTRIGDANRIKRWMESAQASNRPTHV